MIPPVPPAWLPHLEAELGKDYFRDLRTFLQSEHEAGAQILPPAGKLFAALEATPPERVRVVILGQDPYPTVGHAHGLCFSVGADVRPIPGSLRNIYKELASDIGMPPPSHGCLQGWADQGVLLLNTVFTVRAGEAGSHQGRGWETFTDAILGVVNRQPRRVVFMLWGRHAQKKRAVVQTPPHAVVESAHPSPLSARLFLGSRCFSQVNRLLAEAGQPTVDWAHLPRPETTGRVEPGQQGLLL